jgi:predicted dehydrogenase
MTTINLEPADYLPAPPSAETRGRYGIGIVGSGNIVRIAHLPAYRTFGYRVAGVCDVAEAHARSVAEEWNIPFWTTNLDDLLARPDIDIIDLAVHAAARPQLVARIAAAGKHILSQKPFALSLAEAEEMCRVCEEAGVALMVNQQARWAPAHRALKAVLERGTLGHLTSVLHVNRSFQDVPGSWYAAMQDFNILDHGIHYIDLTRYFTGLTPQRIKATTTTMPGQVAVSPMIYSITCEYDPAAQVMSTLHFNNIVRARGAHHYTWWLDGTLGSAWTTQTVGSAWATQTDLTIALPDQEAQTFTLQGRWFPDAFGGSMGELMRALAEGRQPETSGRDNLNSIRMAYAAVESSTTGRAVELT